MNNQDIVSVDKISELPESLILHILSLLPTKVAITTSVLSKQWKSHWKMLPKLTFSSRNHSRERRTFWKNASSSLLSHKAPVLQSFHLKVRLHYDGCTAMETRGLIGLALARNVRKLVLEIRGEPFMFPEGLYNCETLETLKLKSSEFIDVPSTVCLKSLTNLYLYNVDFKDDESAHNLLSGCPNLKNLVLRGIPSCRGKTFTIAVPSLQRLTIYTYRDKSCVINSPSLRCLIIRGTNKDLESCLIENVPELVLADLAVYFQITCEKLLGSLTSVKSLFLDLSPYKIKSPTCSIIFYQLKYLELRTHKPECWNLLAFMLGSSPKLQVLKLIDPLERKKNLWNRGEWNQPKNVPECLMFHLETFIWKGYEWECEEEKEVAKYILRYTNCLKRATFFSKPVDPKERNEMVEDLNSVVRASKSCHLLIKYIY